jgi:hypothetical protein
MLYFRDRTYCSARCATDPCPHGRRLTPEDKVAAERWWASFNLPGHAPISMGDMSGDCKDYKRPEKAP